MAVPGGGAVSPKPGTARSTASQPVADGRSTRRPKLVAQAEALARMTLELSVRAVTQHAERLQQALNKLSTRVERDAGFAAAHQDRLEKMGVEIQAVKAHVDSLKDSRESQDKDDDRLRRDVATGLAAFRGELDDVKAAVASAAAQLSQLPTKAEADAVLSALKTRTEVTAKRSRRHTACALQPVQVRIQETIKSTRRWHLDHKTTKLTDAAFTARYLRKQRRRDPIMARYLHRAIQRTARKRLNEEEEDSENGHRETSLDVACKIVLWEDVTQTIEAELVKNEAAVAQSLSQ